MPHEFVDAIEERFDIEGQGLGVSLKSGLYLQNGTQMVRGVDPFGSVVSVLSMTWWWHHKGPEKICLSICWTFICPNTVVVEEWGFNRVSNGVNDRRVSSEGGMQRHVRL